MELNSASDRDVVTKSEFAKLAGVSAPRVSQWLKDGKLSGDALVGHGHRARIRVAVAKEQLRRNLDVVQHLGANGRAQLAGAGAVVPSTVEDEIKRQRLAQLALANERAREEASARAGIYTRTDDVRQEMGRLVGRLVTMVDGALVEFSTAIAARSDLSSRDALHLLRTSWRGIRERSAEQEKALAEASPPNDETSP